MKKVHLVKQFKLNKETAMVLDIPNVKKILPLVVDNLKLVDTLF